MKSKSTLVGSKTSLVKSLMKIVCIIFCVAAVGVFCANTYMTKTGMEKEKEQMVIQTVQYNKSQVSGWINSQVSELGLVQHIIQKMPVQNLNRENIYPIVENSTENGADNGVISDYVVLSNKQMISGDGWIPEAGYDPTQNEYYTQVKSGDIYVSAPYIDATTGGFVITISMPLEYNGNFYGIVARDVSMSAVQDMVEAHNSKDGSYLYLLDSSGVILSHIDSTCETSEAKKVSITDIGISTMQKCVDNVMKDKDYDKEKKIFYAEQEPISGWVIGLSYPQSILNKEIMQQVSVSLVIFVVVIVVGLAILVMTMKRKFAPIHEITTAAQKLEHGNFDIKLNVNSDDELGFLSSCFQDTGLYLRGIIKEISYILKQLADGNLMVNTTLEYRGEFSEVEIAIKNIIHQMNDIITNIDNVGKQVSAGAAHVAENAHHLSLNSMTQAEQVTQISGDMSLMKETLEKNANRTVETEKEILNVSAQLEQSGNIMNEMMKEMDKIKLSSNEIRNIIKTIEDIAFQTNILALNAAVEAARAGSVGKGFAVVADEVRELANKSALAAQNTSLLIQASIETVERGAEVAHQTEESLSQAVQSINKVVEETREIVKTAQLQKDDIDNITQTVSEFSGAVQSNTAKAEENASTSEEMAEQAKTLKALMDMFNIDTDM